jgi:hypothetical protein
MQLLSLNHSPQALLFVLNVMNVNGKHPAQPQESPCKRTRPSQKEFQRSYKAHIPYRKRNGRCDFGATSSPPCARLSSQAPKCIFSVERSYNSKRQRLSEDNRLSPINSSGTIRAFQEDVNGGDGKSTLRGKGLQTSDKTRSRQAKA